MSVLFKIQASTGPYQVQIGAGLQIRPAKKNSFSIADELVVSLWEASIPKNVFSVLANEKNKTLETAAQIIEAMRSNGIQRGSHLEAFGGGIAAATGSSLDGLPPVRVSTAISVYVSKKCSST
jgi:3-dehydroquinate synthetase